METFDRKDFRFVNTHIEQPYNETDSICKITVDENL